MWHLLSITLFTAGPLLENMCTKDQNSETIKDKLRTNLYIVTRYTMPPPLHPTTTTPLAEIAHYEAVLISNPFTPQNTSGSSIQTDLLEFLRMKKRDSKIIANATISHTALKKSPSSESWEVVNNSPSPSPPPAPPNKPKMHPSQALPTSHPKSPPLNLLPTLRTPFPPPPVPTTTPTTWTLLRRW